MILVTGFGPFPGVRDNPSGVVARQVHGRRVRGHTVVAEVLPVTWTGAAARTLALARHLEPVVVVGLGVAMSREGVQVERLGRRELAARLDAAGELPPVLPGPEQVGATLAVDVLCQALSATPSDDAGSYVCNAWLYQVASGLDCPVGFVHLPAAGLDPERLLAGLAHLV